MKTRLNILTVGVWLALAACSHQEAKQDTPTVAKQPAPASQDNALFSGQNPAMTLLKDGKKLNLVRIMDGAACKNEAQGVKGSFLIYANPEDMERIKREQGTKVFSDFENKIQTFSAEVLQQAVEATNLDDNPFALGKDEAQEKLAKDLAAHFQQAAVAAIDRFEKDTSLTIDITAYPPSLEFYRQGCQAALNESVAPETSPTKP
ncbi:MAG: hypothetical protein PHU14_00935 [Methylovulum sp.]|nr:hypothetical protein [Methylovulum sp.]